MKTRPFLTWTLCVWHKMPLELLSIQCKQDLTNLQIWPLFKKLGHQKQKYYMGENISLYKKMLSLQILDGKEVEFNEVIK